MQGPAQTVLPLRLKSGESPVWDDRENALFFVNIHGRSLHRFDLHSHELRTWTMPAEIGSLGLRERGGAIVALRSGVHFFDFETERLELIAHPENHLPGNRLNDGKVSPEGRFWIGSMDDRPAKEPRGSLYCINPDGTCRQATTGFVTSNGLAWSPDGRTLFHSDSRKMFIEAYDYDPATGAISNQRQLCQLSEEAGRPDGAAVDAEGFYWSAGCSAGCLNRMTPSGVIVEKIAVPVACPSMVCFGGPDMKTLFVTSLHRDKSDDPLAGSLLSFRVEIPGVAVGRFKG